MDKETRVLTTLKCRSECDKCRSCKQIDMEDVQKLKGHFAVHYRFNKAYSCAGAIEFLERMASVL